MPEDIDVAWDILGKDAIVPTQIRYDHTAKIRGIEMNISILKTAPDQGEANYASILEKREEIKRL